MPSLGADMEIGTIVEWKVAPGDVVHRGDIVAVVDTEKSNIDVEVFEDGVVEELLVPVGVEVPVGTPLARIGSGAAAPVARVAPVAPVVVSVPAEHGFVRASPRARALAAQQGVDLASLTGTGRGPGGAVTAADVEKARARARARARAPAAAPPKRTEAERAAAMRHAIGALMARSKREIPHYYLATTVDMSEATTWLAERNESRPVDERILPAALLLKATALAARHADGLNGFWVDDAFVPAPAVHLGVAVSLRGGGLIAPAIHDAAGLPLDGLMRALADLVRRARSGGLRSSEMSDPTITVTNLGDLGVDEVLGVIYPPQVAVVGFGRIAEQPWAAHGSVDCRPVVRATLAADHRASDGHQGARFLAAIGDLLQRPEAL